MPVSWWEWLLCPAHLPLGVNLLYHVVRGIECPETGQRDVGEVQDVQGVVADVKVGKGVEEEEGGVQGVRQGIVTEVERGQTVPRLHHHPEREGRGGEGSEWGVGRRGREGGVSGEGRGECTGPLHVPLYVKSAEH